MQLLYRCGWCNLKLETLLLVCQHCAYHYQDWFQKENNVCHLCHRIVADKSNHFQSKHSDVCHWCCMPKDLYPFLGLFHKECNMQYNFWIYNTNYWHGNQISLWILQWTILGSVWSYNTLLPTLSRMEKHWWTLLSSVSPLCG